MTALLFDLRLLQDECPHLPPIPHKARRVAHSLALHALTPAGSFLPGPA